MSSPGLIDKRSLRFIPYRDCSSIAFEGKWIHKDGHAIAMEESASLRMRLKNAGHLYALFSRHDWSGKVKVSVNGRESDCFDLYSSYYFQQCVRLLAEERPRNVDIRVVILGRNPHSRGSQMVFNGILLPKEEATAPVEPDRPAVLQANQETPAAPPQSFFDLQVHMVDRYVDSLTERGVPLEEEAIRRWAKYTMRFREALVYAAPGCRILDIGAGFLTVDFVKTVIAPLSSDYWAHDIDARAIEHDRAIFAVCGLDPSHARQGTNTDLTYPDSSFDLVFSSHCLEHSDDIERTFSEIRRILKPGGTLFFAVPIGYDSSLEHIYAMDVDGWRALACWSGFEVVNEHVGSIYAEGRHDLVIVARKN